MSKITLRTRYLTSLQDVERIAATLGCEDAGIKIMNNKGVFHTIEVQNCSLRAAIICKQELMALGGEVICSKDVMTLEPERTTILLCATQKQLVKLTNKLFQQPFGCKAIAQDLKQCIENYNKQQDTIQVKNITIDSTKSIIMGIVNVTPDSFSDGGKFLQKEQAITQGKKLIAEGADILDIGAESSRPGSDPVTKEEELARILPVVEALVADPEVTVPISIDTYKPEVADACIQAGAHIINDISGMQSEAMRAVAAKHKVPVIIMHMQGRPKTMQQDPTYGDVVDDIISFFEQQIKVCEEAGITQIICDPGIGFGKTVEHNLQILNRLREFQVLGKPLLIGTSRKSFIAKTVGGTDPEDRLEATIASNVIAAMHGCHIFRVHDVAACKRALTLTKLIQGAQ